MVKNNEKLDKEGAAEKTSRFFRNVNALGAFAIAGAALLIPGPNVVLASWAGLNAAQACGWELLRQHTEKNRKKRK